MEEKIRGMPVADAQRDGGGDLLAAPRVASERSASSRVNVVGDAAAKN